MFVVAVTSMNHGIIPNVVAESRRKCNLLRELDLDQA